MDEYLLTAIKLLHSSAPDSAEKMRNILNTEILKYYDKTKLVENQLLSKKQIDSLIIQETKAVGSGFKVKKHKTKKIEEAKLATTAGISENQIIKSRDDNMDSSSDDNSSAAMDLLTDLTCVACRQVDSTANNQLFECIECHQLWHQLCHTSKIPSDSNQSSWICSACKIKKKEQSSKSTKSYESSSSSSSSHHKEKKREKEEKEEKKSSEKRKSEGSSSSKSQKKFKESSSSSSSRSRSSKKNS